MKSAKNEGVPVNPAEEAVEAYSESLKRVRALRAEWARLGEPLTAEGGATGRAVVAHPVLREIREEEKLADRLRQGLLVKRMGRPPEAIVEPKLGRAPSQLRAVK
jgi:hypothetical protein